METLGKEYFQMREAHYLRIANNIKNNLTRRGISGSAIVPKVEASTDWQDTQSKLRACAKISLSLNSEKNWMK